MEDVLKLNFKKVLNDIVFIDPNKIRCSGSKSIINTLLPKLSLNEFILSKNYDISKMFINTMWTKLNSFDTNDMILVDDEMYMMFGYKTTGDKCHDREKFKRRLIGRKDRKKTLGFIENIDYRIENLPPPPAGGGRSKHGGAGKEDIYITRKTFKKLCLSMNTENNDRIQEYFLLIDDIFIEYMKYEYEYDIEKKKRELVMKDDKIDVLLKQNTEIIEKNTEIVKKLEISEIEIKSLSSENKIQSQQLVNLSEDFKLLMKRTECIDDALKNEKCLHEETHRLLDEIKNENTEVKEKLDTVIETVENVIEHVVPEIKQEHLTDHLCVLHDRNDLDHYYFIRTQCRVIHRSVKLIQKEYPGMYVLIDEIDYTHPKNLFVLLKNHLKENGDENVFVNYNHVHVFENYITHSSNPEDHKLITILNDIKNGIMQSIKDTINDFKIKN